MINNLSIKKISLLLTYISGVKCERTIENLQGKQKLFHNLLTHLFVACDHQLKHGGVLCYTLYKILVWDSIYTFVGL